MRNTKNFIVGEKVWVHNSPLIEICTITQLDALRDGSDVVRVKHSRHEQVHTSSFVFHYPSDAHKLEGELRDDIDILENEIKKIWRDPIVLDYEESMEGKP